MFVLTLRFAWDIIEIQEKIIMASVNVNSDKGVLAMEVNPIIMQMTEDIVKMCSPFRVFLISEKNNRKGELTSFKLCIIVADSYENRINLEAEILINTDCPVPCDIVVYTVTEWNDCVEDDCSFAYRVDNAGEVLYEQE